MNLSLSINMCNPSGLSPPPPPLLVLGKKGVVRSLKGWGLSFPAARWGCTHTHGGGASMYPVYPPNSLHGWAPFINTRGCEGEGWSVNLSLYIGGSSDPTLLQCTIPCTMYIVQFTVHCTMYTLQCTAPWYILYKNLVRQGKSNFWSD
jgi:hypothetical protein